MIRRAELDDEKEIARVHVKSWQTTYKGIIKEEIINHLSTESREKYWRESIASKQLIFVALNEEGEIIGFASGGKSRFPEYHYDGELYAIYILEEYQRKGIGKQLISAVANELKAHGYQAMIVWVLTDNPSKNAYERLGASTFDSKQIEIGGEFYKEEVLVWTDINQQW